MRSVLSIDVANGKSKVLLITQKGYFFNNLSHFFIIYLGLVITTSIFNYNYQVL